MIQIEMCGAGKRFSCKRVHLCSGTVLTLIKISDYEEREVRTNNKYGF